MGFPTRKYQYAFHTILLATLAVSQEVPQKQPNIIVIIADDMGINDLSLHGSDQIPTPNIDALGIFGIGLNHHYVAPMCTPTRASFLTGKYPINLGLQHYVIPSWEPWGLGLDQKVMPEYLKEVGYKTHAVGKWHLGFFRRSYTPLMRGFDTHHGYLGPYIDYWNHSLSGSNVGLGDGLDMRHNLDIDHSVNGTYATDHFTDAAVKIIENHDKSSPMFLYLAHLAPHAANDYDPLQAPEESIRQFGFIHDANRRKYAAMVSALDASVGRVVKALADSEMLDNSVILFFTDNGGATEGMHANTGSNYPFKGQKDTPWEGAVRSGCTIWSSHLTKRQRASNQLVHVSDWLPTFGHLAGYILDRPIDGHNVWPALSNATDSPRAEVLVNIDDLIPYSSYIQRNWKYVTGSTSDGEYDKWMGLINETERHPSMSPYDLAVLKSEAGQVFQLFQLNQMGEQMSPDDIVELRRQYKLDCNGRTVPTQKHLRCTPLTKVCLFNLADDPCEMVNLANVYPKKVLDMEKRVNELRLGGQLPRNVAADWRSNPRFFNNTWTWWVDVIEEKKMNSVSSTARADGFLYLIATIVVLLFKCLVV